MEPHLTTHLSRSIEFLREGHEWTQSEWASRAGVSERSIRRIEAIPMASASGVSTSLLDSLGKAAGIPTGFLVLTPDVLVAAGISICGVRKRKKKLKACSVGGPLGRKSRAYVTIAQGGNPHDLLC